MILIQGNLLHSVSSINTPIPSDVRIGITFHRNKNEILIDNLNRDNPNAIFRIYIAYFELQVKLKKCLDACLSDFFQAPRVITEVPNYLAIEKKMKLHPMRIIYNRLELTSQMIPGIPILL